MSALVEDGLFERRKRCESCQTLRGEWWWYCSAHDVWECDSCSQDEGYADDEGSHRFRCDSHGVCVDARRRTATVWCGPEGPEEAS